MGNSIMGMQDIQVMGPYHISNCTSQSNGIGREFKQGIVKNLNLVEIKVTVKAPQPKRPFITDKMHLMSTVSQLLP
jgi:hypothetical protein